MIKFNLFKNYSSFVFTAKTIFIILGIGLILFIILLSLYNPTKKNFRFNSNSSEQQVEEKKQPASSRIENPHFYGINNNNEMYNVMAKLAIQQEKDIFFLEFIEAVLNKKDGKKITIISDNGLWNSKNKHLTLKGGVELFTQDGTRVYTDYVEVDLLNNILTGNSDVTIVDNRGRLEAKSFVMFKEPRKIIFKGSVKVKIYN